MTARPWTESLLHDQATIRMAIENLTRTCLQIILVIDEQGRLVGTVTDGDIRRGLLLNQPMDNTPLSTIMQPNPLLARPHEDRASLVAFMQDHHVSALPMIDDMGRPIGLALLSELLSPLQRPNRIIIMAGGQGKRLRPHTSDCPKPMLLVGDKPMLEHIIIRARNEGFSHFTLSVHYLAHMIMDYFGDGSRWNIHIDYLHEDQPLGTAGALSLLLQKDHHPLLITNGDVMSDISFGTIIDFHTRNQADSTMAVRLHEWQHPFGVIQTEGINFIGIEEKPLYQTYINAGIYVLEPHCLSHLETNTPCDMPTLFLRIRMAGQKTIVYHTDDPWMDVGRPDDLEMAIKLHDDRKKN